MPLEGTERPLEAESAPHGGRGHVRGLRGLRVAPKAFGRGGLVGGLAREGAHGGSLGLGNRSERAVLQVTGPLPVGWRVLECHLESITSSKGDSLGDGWDLGPIRRLGDAQGGGAGGCRRAGLFGG